MNGYLKRLVRALAAYQVADVVAKFMAVILLPVYTHYIATSRYGDVEVLANSVIFVSIVIRFGTIEAFLRYYYTNEDQERRDALARRAVLFLLIATTVTAALLSIDPAALSKLVLRHRDVPLFRVAVLGLWAFTNLELAYGLLRVDERVRTYTVASLANVTMTIASSVVLVVVLHQGALGLLLGNYGASAVVLFALWWSMRERLRPKPGRQAEGLGTLLHFGLPTVPAEASVYALSLIDRYFIEYKVGKSPLGYYSFAVKLAGTVAFVVRAFQYAWPPLAYSLADDAEASRFYGLVTTYYVLLTGWIVAGLALLGRWLVKLLAGRPDYYPAYRAVPWLALGWALYGLWVILLVVAGRANVTTRNFPAALVGLLVNVALLFLLVPPLGVAGAGIALCGAYVGMLVVMHLLTRSAFEVQFEWSRLSRIVLVFGGLAVAGELLLPAHGALGLLSRGAVALAMPGALLATGFLHPSELAGLRQRFRIARERT